MAREIKNFYGVLGIEMDAAQEEIKKAYRRLARTLHPDVNKAEDAQEKFQEVQEAYEVLSDEKLRKEYDEFLKTGGKGTRPVFNYEFQDIFDMFFRKPRTAYNPINGKNIHAEVLFTVYEALNKQTKELFIGRQRVCHDCHGRMFIQKDGVKCHECEGKGYTKKKIKTPLGSIDAMDTCKSCDGRGYANTANCTVCEGVGLLPGDIKIAVELPKGVHDGYTMRVHGKGQPGRDGGKDGDLLLTFKHTQTDRYQIENTFDVISKHNIDLVEALTGGVVSFIYPDGTKGELQIPEGMSSGDRLCIPDKGLFNQERGYYGSYYVEMNLQLPKVNKDQARKIVAALS